ncbi:hypothetical protein ACFQ3N_04860 [Virgibacillus byunsanensis]|uniref:Uncharacterized protein n=1 Tax=Virgibacillus byunsanensis TaxID=570945 RepID=A0ABW3LH85_9BACI
MSRKKRQDNKQPLTKREHEFSEELSDSGERDQIIKKQSPKSCGGL